MVPSPFVSGPALHRIHPGPAPARRRPRRAPGRAAPRTHRLALLVLAAALLAPRHLSASAPAPVRHTLTRAGVELALTHHPSRREPARGEILLIHGLTYSSHEFHVDVKGYSLARALTRAGFSAWRLDLAGYGQSSAVEDGFMVDAGYAAQDIAAAVAHIKERTGAATVDLLGWSWGTITASRMAVLHPGHVGRLVLYAPILNGRDGPPPEEAWHANSWAHAASDFPMRDGEIDTSRVEPAVAAAFLSACWRHDGARSPNGGRREGMAGAGVRLLDLSRIQVPVLIIGGGADPYVDWREVSAAFSALPRRAESRLVVLEGGSHILMLEKAHHRRFQRAIISFLGAGR